TLIEQAAPLVHAADEKYFSPWKGTYRSPQGVLHALYVFRVIDQCLERLLALSGWSLSSADHMRHRRHEIASQVHRIKAFKGRPRPDCPGDSFCSEAHSRVIYGLYSGRLT